MERKNIWVGWVNPRYDVKVFGWGGRWGEYQGEYVFRYINQRLEFGKLGDLPLTFENNLLHLVV